QEMRSHPAGAGRGDEPRRDEHRRVEIPQRARQPAAVVGAGDGQLPDHIRLGGRECAECRFRRLSLGGEMKKSNALPPVHPGEILREDVLPEAGLSVTAAARALGVSRQMVNAILAGRRPLSAVMCLKVARLFGSTPQFWMRLQAVYDLKKAEQDKKVMERVARIVPVKPVEEVRA